MTMLEIVKLNNASYVIMLACVKSISICISEGGTDLVFLANILPALSIILSAPYSFDHVGCNARICLGMVLCGRGRPRGFP
jgi:hypothetical protein